MVMIINRPLYEAVMVMMTIFIMTIIVIVVTVPVMLWARCPELNGQTFGRSRTDRKGSGGGNRQNGSYQQFLHLLVSFFLMIEWH